jgi:hypothetical protein
MSISARGPKNHLVLERTGVLIKEIWDAVADHKDIDWLTQRYPVTADEVFECMDALVDLTDDDDKDFIKLNCTNGSSFETLELEAVGITDRVFFSVVGYGKALNSESTDIQDLFSYGLMLIINDCLADIKSGVSDYKNSHLHNLVYNAFVDAYSQIAPVDSIMDIIDRGTFNSVKDDDDEQH